MDHNFILSGFADEASPNLGEQIALLKKLGVSYLEPRNVNGKNIVDLTDGELRDMAAQLKEAGIGVSSIGSPVGKIGIHDDMDAECRRLDRALTAAEILGAPYVRVFSFFMKQEEADSLRGEVHSRMERFMRVAEGRGAKLLHENEKGIYGDTDDRCLDLLQQFGPSGLKAIFDPANFLQCGVRPEVAFEKLCPYVAYMHIKDARLGQMEVVPAGRGDGHIKEILSALTPTEMFLSLEPHLSVSPWMENIMADEKIDRTDGNNAVALWTLAHKSLTDLLLD